MPYTRLGETIQRVMVRWQVTCRECGRDLHNLITTVDETPAGGDLCAWCTADAKIMTCGGCGSKFPGREMATAEGDYASSGRCYSCRLDEIVEDLADVVVSSRGRLSVEQAQERVQAKLQQVVK